MKHNFKKSLGQNFLTDKNIINKISDCVEKSNSADKVFEIGSGSGIFTRELAKIYDEVLASEFDSSLIDELQLQFKNQPKVRLLQGDFLKLDFAGHANKKIDIFGNIPYYLTSEIFQKIFESRDKISRVFLTIQKEVLDKIEAGPKDKKYGYFSCLVNYFLRKDNAFMISENSFFPRPKVKSAFVSFSVKPGSLDNKLADNFLTIIKLAFGHRRKTVYKNLQVLAPSEKVKEALKLNKISPTQRAESISLDKFINLAEML